MRKLIILLSLLSLFFIFGCTPVKTAPVVPYHAPVGPASTPPPQQPLVPENFTANITVQTFTVLSTEIGNISKLVYKDSNLDIVNCGSIAYGAVVVEEARRLVESGKVLRNLVISNVTENYFGGCKTVITELYEIKKIQIYTHAGNVYSAYVNDTLKWAPKYKIEYIDGDYVDL